jgi:2-phosphosulfolactate phosphatase
MLSAARRIKEGPGVHLDWGVDGLKPALKRGNLVVVVDTLRFSSTVVTALAEGFIIYPVSDLKFGKVLAESLAAELAGKPGTTRYSLSPRSFLNSSCAANKKVVLYSPNGAACSELVKKNDLAYIGCLLNARACARHVLKVAIKCGRSVTMIAAGEQEALASGERIMYIHKAARRVFAVEDYLGCGAILDSMALPKSPEARVSMLAFRAARPRIKRLLLESFSGIYLAQRGLRKDVEHAARVNAYDVIPVIRDGKIESAIPFKEEACQTHSKKS